MQASRISDSSQITKRELWALYRYPDNSEFCFRTTLNQTILAKYGIILEERCLPRLDKKYLVNGEMIYRQFSYDGVTISMWESETYTDKRSARLRHFL